MSNQFYQCVAKREPKSPLASELHFNLLKGFHVRPTDISGRDAFEHKQFEWTKKGVSGFAEALFIRLSIKTGYP